MAFRCLLQYHVDAGRLERAGRGVFRLIQFPPGEHDDLIALWLWSARLGVFSHETALLLHELSDALPSERHLTLPLAWQQRRLRKPAGVELHFADIPDEDRAWLGPVPMTAPLRTILECIADHVQPDFVRQAIEQAIERGLFSWAELERTAPGHMPTTGGRR